MSNTQWMQHEAIRGGGKPGAASKPQSSKQSKPWGQRDMGKLQFADDGMYGDAAPPEQPLGPVADAPVSPFFIGAQDTSKPWWLQDSGTNAPMSPDLRQAPPSPPLMGDAEAPDTPTSDAAQGPQSAQGPPNQSKLDELNAEKLALLQGLPTKGHSPWWAQLAANAVGGLAGWSNAASRTAHPINIAATKEGLLHPIYNEQMIEAQSKLAPIDAQIEQVQGQNTNWWNTQGLKNEAAYKQAEQERATAQAKYYMDRSGNQWKMDPRSGVLYNTDSGATVQPQKTAQDTYNEVLKVTGNKDAATEAAYHVKLAAPKATNEIELYERAQGTGPDAEQARRIIQQQQQDKIRVSRESRPPASVNNITLTPEAIKMAADSYAATGVVPSVGYGKDAAAMRSVIMNQAAKDHPGTVLADAKTDYAANSGAIKNLEKQQAAILTFENTAGKNLDLADSISRKVDRTGVPVINRFLLQLKGQYAGDTDTQLLNNAVETASNEYAKVVSGGSGNQAVTDSARQHARDMLTAAMGKGTFHEAVQLMKQEMGNRRSGYGDELKSLRSGRSGGQQQGPPVSNNPIDGGYLPNHVYGGQEYLGGGSGDAKNWRPAAK